MQVIGICQHHLRPRLLKLCGSNGFHICQRTYGHKTGSFNRAVGSVKDTRTGFRVAATTGNLEGKLRSQVSYQEVVRGVWCVVRENTSRLLPLLN